MTLAGEDAARVRHYFTDATNELVSDEAIAAALDWFKGDSQRHMLAARSIVRSLRECTCPTPGCPRHINGNP